MIRLSDNLEVNKPAPVDDRLGVFSSTASALAYIPEDRRYIGLTLIVDTGSGATEYWFENGVTDGDLTGKSTGGGSQVNSDWNATSGVAEILNKPTIPSVTNLVPYTGATEDVNLGTHDLYSNKVYLLDEANDNYGSIHYTDGDFHIEDADGHKLLVIEDGFMQLHLTDTIQSNLFTSDLSETRNHYLPNQSGTIALTTDITKTAIGLANVDNTSDANKPISTATQTALNAKEPTINAGTTAQYYRGDKTFQTLNSTAVGLGNVDNTSDANKPISTATQTALSRITTLFQDVSQLSTTSTTAVTLTTFTVASSIIPVGGVIRISGLIERTAGTGNTTVGINVNSGGARYLQSAGTNSQFEMLICKTTSTNVRYGLGASNTTGNSFTGHNSTSISVAQDGSGNFVISFLGLVGTAGATLTVQFVKGNLL